MVDSCEILIVVWNGKPPKGRGGTADIISHATLQDRVVLWINSENPAAAPKLIKAAARTHFTGDPDKDFRFKPFPSVAKELSAGYHQLAAYNRDGSLDSTEFVKALEIEAKELLGNARSATLSTTYVDPVIAHLLPHYVRADRLAGHYQRRYLQASKGLHYLAAVAVSVVAAQILFFPRELWLIVFEILAMAGALTWWGAASRGKWHEKWLHDRYLAEGLRTAMFAVLVGHSASEHALEPARALPFYAGPENWLSATVQRIAAVTRESLGEAADIAPLKKFLIDGWLRAQATYHRDTADKTDAHRWRRHVFGRALFLITMALAVMHFLGIGHTEHEPPVGVIGNWITFFAVTLPAWGAAVHAITMQLEYDRIAARSQRMAKEFNVAIERCQRASSLPELRQAIRETEQVIGIENHEWWVLLSFRHPELPV